MSTGEDKKRILIIEDEPHVSKYIRMFLEDAGFEILCADDGQSGMDLLRKERPDLVILDLMMPKKTGTDFYKRLTRDKELAGTPVIVVSGLAGRDLAVKNAVAVFEKPPDREKLIAAVKKAVA
ncbi:response regulator [Elusimicrobiota bacterium]